MLVTLDYSPNMVYSGVAVGSSIGHAIGGFFGGGSSQPAEASATQAPEMSNSNYQNTTGGACEESAKAFTRCLDENNGSPHQMSICSYYLDQLVRIIFLICLSRVRNC